MISLPDFKKLLGPLAERLTEDEILELRDIEYQVADSVIEWWLQKRKDDGENDAGSRYNIPSIEF